jgi:hypothetical protein
MKIALPPVLIAIALGAIGLISVWLQQPLLVPSLGSAVFLEVLTPLEPSARAWPSFMGQIIGATSGFIGVLAAGAAFAPHFVDASPLVLPRVGAMLIAVIITAIVQPLLKATNAAGGATALVVALGAESVTAGGAARLFAGIVVATALGETARWIIVRTR